MTGPAAEVRPKAQLRTRCAELEINAPAVRHRVVADKHQVELTLELDDWEITSGAVWASTRADAEDLAARELLEELEELEASAPAQGSETVEVAFEDHEYLRTTNPKGRLFEWTQRQKPQIARPRFEQRRDGGRMSVRAHLATLDLSSPWFRAERRALAEHAAAEALLRELERGERDALITHPAALLNELQQDGTVSALEIEVEAVGEGYRARGELVFANGSAERAEAERPSKRRARLAVMRELLEHITS